MDELTTVDIIDDTAEFFAPANTDMVDGLISQYRVMRAKVERVAAVMNGPDMEGALHYFAEAAAAGERHLSASTIEALFDLDAALAYLNAGFWSKALHLTDVLDLMPQKRRDEWHEQIRNPLGVKRNRYSDEWITPPIPEFTEDNVRSTLVDLLAKRERFFAERVDGIFQAMSRTHITNAPEGFGRRMILSRAVDDWCTPNYGTCGVINDLRCVIARFMGRDEPRHGHTDPLIRYARERRGEWITVDGGALRVRCYAVGTAHLEVHPDMAWRLNSVLAQLHPLAIPSQFRERPKKRLKDFVMSGRPLPFAVLARLASLAPARDLSPDRGYRQDTWVKVPGCYDLRYGSDVSEAVRAETARVLECLGGAPVGKNSMRWAFDYDPLEVIQEIAASGCIPDQKAHQFYPTPEALARQLVELADIEPGHTVLEPSAGMGGLADLLPKESTTCVEVSPLHCKVLEAKGHSVVEADFLEWAQDKHSTFDRVVMNPPFSDGRWQAHLAAAAHCVKPGGKLAAILPASARSKVRDLLPGFDAEVHAQHDGAFPGTSVSVVMVTADAVPW